MNDEREAKRNQRRPKRNVDERHQLERRHRQGDHDADDRDDIRRWPLGQKRQPRADRRVDRPRATGRSDLTHRTSLFPSTLRSSRNLGSHRLSKPMTICTAMMTTMVASVVGTPGMPPSGVNPTMLAASSNGAKERLPTTSRSSRTET